MGDFNPLEGVGHAQIFEKGKYLQPGQYALEVKRTIYKATQKSGDCFIVEFEVLESSDEEAHAIGSHVSWVQKLVDKNVAFPSIKDFFLNLMGIDKDDNKAMDEFSNGIDTVIGQAINKPDLLAGNRIRVETFMTKTKGKGLDFTVHRWAPYGDD